MVTLPKLLSNWLSQKKSWGTDEGVLVEFWFSKLQRVIPRAEFLPERLKREMKIDEAKHGNLTEDVRQKWEEKIRRSKYIFHSHMLQSSWLPHSCRRSPVCRRTHRRTHRRVPHCTDLQNCSPEPHNCNTALSNTSKCALITGCVLS